MVSILDFINTKSKTNNLEENTNENTTENNVNNNCIIKIFTDGACINNGKKNAKAGIGVYFGKNDSRNISERITGKQSNNTAELKAIIKAYEILKDEIDNNESIHIYSDSVYAIRACGEYGLKMSHKNWKRRNMKTKQLEYIPNHELVKLAFNLFQNKHYVKLIHVKAHTKNMDELSLGNAEADRLANEAIGHINCPYNKNIHKDTVKNNKTYLNVPFTEKDIAKKLGAKWDFKVKKWYYTDLISKENEIKLIKLFKK